MNHEPIWTCKHCGTDYELRYYDGICPKCDTEYSLRSDSTANIKTNTAMTTHKLKIHSNYFNAIKSGVKTFEIRKNDRDFKIGDKLILEEVYPIVVSNKTQELKYTGQSIDRYINYIFDMEFMFGLFDHVVLGLTPQPPSE